MAAAQISRPSHGRLAGSPRGERRGVSLECELADGACPVTGLREALLREATLMKEKDAWIEQKAVLSREADHRLLNNLQMVSSLLSMQSRTAGSDEAATALAVAAVRVAAIGRLHRRLRSNDGAQTVALKQFIEELCRDYSDMLAVEGRAAREIVITGLECELPNAIGAPLCLVVNELITNALKYGDGLISVQLEEDPRQGFALSVENEGPALPEDYDPADSKGLGMRIIQSLLATLGGDLVIRRGAGGDGARFTVLFSPSSPEDARVT